MTTKQLAEKFGVSVGIMYGLLRFLAETGLITTTKAEKKEGAKGKSATLYAFDDELGSRITAYLAGKLNAPTTP